MSSSPAPSPRYAPVPLIDWGKAIASQLIVWHHLVMYGPMIDLAQDLAPDLATWLMDQARIAVQAFLVMGGFLAARGLMPAPGQSHVARAADLPGLLWKRYVRLAKPLWVVLVLAVLAAALTRALIDYDETPGTPSLAQLLANALLLQDLLGQEALSAGLWYVAIDFQLFALLAALALLVSQARSRIARRSLSIAGVMGLVALSLFWFNRQPELSAWAPYFFGAYGLGVMAHWVTLRQDRATGLLWMAALAGLALWIEWRSRIAVAGVVALLLAFNPGSHWLRQRLLHPVMAFIARISYSLFLVHYAVCMVLGAVVARLWPDSPALNAAGLVLAWLASLVAGYALHRWVEAPRRVNSAAAAAAAVINPGAASQLKHPPSGPLAPAPR